MATTITTSTSFGSALQSLIDVLKNDALKAALPLINTFLSNVITNPNAVNVVAQASALQVNLIAALPTLETNLASDVAKILQAQIAGLMPTAAA